MEEMKNVSSSNRATPVVKRVERLTQFLKEYKELWYDNWKSLEDKINLIADDEDEKVRIKALYKQAEDDYFALRVIRSRFYDHKNGNITTPFYKVTEEQFETLRQAGIGRAFGLSDENQAEYDRLAKAGIDDETLRFIFRKFSSYQRFKEAFCEAMLKGKEQEIIKKCPKLYTYIVSEIDLSKSNGIRNDDRHYIDLLRDILGVQYFVFDGKKLVETIEAVIDFDIDRSRLALTEKERDIVRRIYGLGTEKMSSEKISRMYKISNSRTRQILNHALAKLCSRKKQLLNTVFLSDQNEVTKFLVNYFKKNDIFRLEVVEEKTEHNEEPIDDSKADQKDKKFEFNAELYNEVLANNLRAQMVELDRARANISEKLKILCDGQLDRFEELKLEDYRLERMLIDRFELSRRTCNSLTNKSICSIGDIIAFSRKTSHPIMYSINNMGEKSYEELNNLMNSLGLKLEDEDKSEKTRICNDRILGRMSKMDAMAFYLYLEQIRYRISCSIMPKCYKEKFDRRISLIEESNGIYLTDEDTISLVKSRIDELGNTFNYDTPISVFKVPNTVIKMFKSHGLNKVRDLYLLRNKDVNYLKKNYGAYFDLILSELSRMGLQYPLVDKEPNNMMKHATYINKTNIELITFLITESNLDAQTKDSLKRQLLDKITQVENARVINIDNELGKKISSLKMTYNILESKEEELTELEKNQNTKTTDPDDDFGDIV